VKRLLLLLLIAGLALWGWRWWRSDERRILARWHSAQELFEKSGPEDQLTAFGRVRSITELFAPGFVVSARPYEETLAGTQELAAVVHRYRDGAKTIEVADGERDLELFDNATALLTATVRVAGERGSGPGRERFRVRVAWREDEGVWRISELEILEVLEDSGLF
jgi:hypothetical protein